ncbi:hypothetical protein TNCV_2135821 [Trichonephila clavipes]|nr:hypothetical protein TNCV_2135821 [Trichonephila clavipes]
MVNTGVTTPRCPSDPSLFRAPFSYHIVYLNSGTPFSTHIICCSYNIVRISQPPIPLHITASLASNSHCTSVTSSSSNQALFPSTSPMFTDLSTVTSPSLPEPSTSTSNSLPYTITPLYPKLQDLEEKSVLIKTLQNQK